MRRIATSTTMVILAGLGSLRAEAGQIIDQANIFAVANQSVFVPNGTQTGQSFTAGLDGIDFVAFYFLPGDVQPVTASVSIYQGVGTHGPLLATSGTAVIPGYTTIVDIFSSTQFDFASRVSLVAGSQYSLIINPGAGATLLSAQLTIGDAYAGGAAIFGGSASTDFLGTDLKFSEGIIVPDAVAPEPSTLAGALIAAVAGIGAAARRRRAA